MRASASWTILAIAAVLIVDLRGRGDRRRQANEHLNKHKINADSGVGDPLITTMKANSPYFAPCCVFGVPSCLKN
jgi:hypothetical protein